MAFILVLNLTRKQNLTSFVYQLKDIIMFGIFKKSTPIEKLTKEHKKIMKQAFLLSHTDRKASDALMAKGEEILKQIESIKGH